MSIVYFSLKSCYLSCSCYAQESREIVIRIIDKEHIIAAYYRNDENTETARHLIIAEGTAYAIIRRYQRFEVAA